MFSTAKFRIVLLVSAVGLFVPTCEDWAVGAPPARDANVTATHTFRASALTGMTVRNPAGEELGQIEDLLLDVRSGRIDYAILSHGGFFGLGDKLFPIPWREMKLYYGADETHFIVDATPQFLRRVPSFEREHWPEASDGWTELVESLFPIHTGEVVSVTEDRLMMTFAAGGEHEHAVAADVLVTRDGETVHLLDLEPGDRVRVETEEQAGIRVVVKIDAHSAAEGAETEDESTTKADAAIEE